MAKSSTSFKKGEVNNPKGKPSLPPDLKLLMRTTSEQMKRDICEVWAMPVKELLSFAPGVEDISAGRAAIISCLNNSIQTGDDRALKAMMDRVLGKVPEALPEDPEKPTANKDETIARLVSMMNDRPTKNEG